MGRTTTPKYVIVLWDQDAKTTMAWRGRASEKALAKFVQAMQASYQDGGVNSHIKTRYGEVPLIERAQIRLNTPGVTPMIIEWIKD